MTGGPSPESGPLGLYIHIPYCAALCSYCDFFRTQSGAGVPDPFVDLLLAEADLYREDPPIAADTVYFGGGTPSLLSAGQLVRLLDGLRERFALEPHAEITLEANPETVGAPGAAAWLRAGVNRLSLGVQSFGAREVAVLGRRCAPDRAREAVLTASECGFGDISLDLMGGVPGQEIGSLTASLREALSLPITHLSFYLLELHRGTPLHRQVASGELELPGEDALADLYEAALATLAAEGFEHYEISNFALPGYRCRHNLKYWNGGDYIGLGPSAHGRFRGWMTADPRSVEDWSDAVLGGGFPHEPAERITGRRRLEDSAIFGLRLGEGVHFETLAELVDEGRLAERLERIAGAGYAEVEGGRVRLTSRGFLVSNEIIGWLLPDLGRER